MSLGKRREIPGRGRFRSPGNRLLASITDMTLFSQLVNAPPKRRQAGQVFGRHCFGQARRLHGACPVIGAAGRGAYRMRSSPEARQTALTGRLATQNSCEGQRTDHK
jgi:hypothetical protein